MNSTVWYDQIDAGLVKYIKSVIQIKNSVGEYIPVPIRVRKADEDFKKEDYPMVTIYNLEISKRDEVRYYPFRVPRGLNTENGIVNMERTAVPYSLMYQIDLWSTLQRDMNAMSAMWEFEAGRDFNLPVIDSGGTLRYAHCLQKGNSVKKVDKLNDGSRVFCTSLTYRIWAEIDEENPDKLIGENIVNGVDFDIKPDYIKEVLT